MGSRTPSRRSSQRGLQPDGSGRNGASGAGNGGRRADSSLQRLGDVRGEVGRPVRIAAVDVGSNAIRFAAAEAADSGAFTFLEQERAAVRLGHGVFLSGRLAASAMDSAVAALVGHARRMHQLGVGVYRAVATSAVREARNGVEFLERVRSEAGLDVDVIGGADEARLVYLAVRRAVPLDGKEWILADLGGGSVEVSLVDDSGILWSESHTMGSVRLLEELSDAGQEPGRFQRLLEEYADTLRLPSAASYRRPAGFIATGGNIESLGRLAGVGASPGGVALLPMDRLQAVIDTLTRLSYAQRVEELGLRGDRADVVLPAALVYQRLARLAGADAIHIPGVGIREGVLMDILETLTARSDHASRQHQEVVSAALAMGRRYMFEESHARQVCTLALSLFDQLRECHGLGDHERELLTAAALLHDIGAYISYKKHHKHSMYLISHGELPGFSVRDITLTAVIARYHRRSEPAERHPEFAALAPREREIVVRLAAILRLADALDREHRDRVHSVRLHLDGDTLHMRIVGEGDLYLEKWALERKSGLFEKTFNRSIKVHNGASST